MSALSFAGLIWLGGVLFFAFGFGLELQSERENDDDETLAAVAPLLTFGIVSAALWPIFMLVQAARWAWVATH